MWFYGSFRHLCLLAGKENIEGNSYLQLLIWKMDCNYIRYGGFIYAEMQFNDAAQSLKISRFRCENTQRRSLPKSLLLRGVNTYWHTSHMRAKNRNHPHSHHQPLPPIISPFSTHLPPPALLPALFTCTHTTPLCTTCTFSVSWRERLERVHVKTRHEQFLGVIFLNMSPPDRLFVFPW